MIEIDTVLILGAGASQPFGFPSGKELVNKICSVFSDPQRSQYSLMMQAGHPQPEVQAFRNVLYDANPASVDAWLEHNPKFIPIGKAAIATLLLDYERKSKFRPENNWYELLFQDLDSPFNQFQENKLKIVTFNYDRSLEQYLFTKLTNTYTGKSVNEYVQILQAIPIIHVYGSLGLFDWQPQDPKHYIPFVQYGAPSDYNTINSAAKNIKIIPEAEKIAAEFTAARRFIRGAAQVFFLGFGYDLTNLKRLGTDPKIDIIRVGTKVRGTIHKLKYSRIREVESLGIPHFNRTHANLLNKTIYEFLYNHVHFNEL